MMTASPFAAGPARASHLYRQVAVESQIDGHADGHRLITMLFDGFFEAVAQARGAHRSQDTAARSRAIGRATAIVEEGLRASLDVKAGGTLARDLNELYGYVVKRLLQANLATDEQALDECVRLVQPLAEAWAAIRPRATQD